MTEKQIAANPHEYPLADFCEATNLAVMEYEDESGDIGCPLCGRSAEVHRAE